MTISLYSAFGLTIASEFPLPDLPSGGGDADVRIGFGAIGESVPESSGWAVFARPGEVHGWCPGAECSRAGSGPLLPIPAGRTRHIVVFDQQAVSRKLATVPTAADIERLGGNLEARQSDQMVITLPATRAAELRTNPAVKFMEAVVYEEQAAVAPAPPPRRARVERDANGTAAPRVHSESAPDTIFGPYTYDGAGNITSIGGTAGTTNYTYDTVSRLVGADIRSETQGHPSPEVYNYDGFGNMTSRVRNGATRNLRIDSQSNRMSAPTAQYDAAGSVTQDQANQNYHWDALGMMVEKDFAPAQHEYYVYNASDERIAVNMGSNWTWSLRDPTGKVLRQYRSVMAPSEATHTSWTWVEDYVYRDGQLVSANRVPEEGGERHFHLDHLGSPRLVTNVVGGVVVRHDFYPFGQELTPLNGETSAGLDREDPMKFTGHERDYTAGVATPNENYLDYMHARYDDPGMGRFLSLDPVLGTPGTPQSWNRYAYVNNNPIDQVDVDGRSPEGIELLWTRLKHIINRHIDEDQFTRKSKFIANRPKDVQKLVSKTVKVQNLVETQEDGRKIYVKKFNKEVGTRGESTVRVVTEPVAEDTEKVITAYTTLPTLMSVMNVGLIVHSAVKYYNYAHDFSQKNGRDPSFNETLRFVGLGDARPDPAPMDVLHTVY